MQLQDIMIRLLSLKIDRNTIGIFYYLEHLPTS